MRRRDVPRPGRRLPASSPRFGAGLRDVVHVKARGRAVAVCRPGITTDRWRATPACGSVTRRSRRSAFGCREAGRGAVALNVDPDLSMFDHIVRAEPRSRGYFDGASSVVRSRCAVVDRVRRFTEASLGRRGGRTSRGIGPCSRRYEIALRVSGPSGCVRPVRRGFPRVSNARRTICIPCAKRPAARISKCWATAPRVHDQRRSLRACGTCQVDTQAAADVESRNGWPAVAARAGARSSRVLRAAVARRRRRRPRRRFRDHARVPARSRAADLRLQRARRRCDDLRRPDVLNRNLETVAPPRARFGRRPATPIARGPRSSRGPRHRRA